MSKYKLLLSLLMSVLFFASSIFAEEIVTKKELENSYNLAKKWFLSAQRPNGIFDYLYEPLRHQYLNDNNDVRQLMAARLLAELSAEDSNLLPAHQKNINFLFNFWVKNQSNISYIYFQEKSKLGANAMMLRTLVASPLFEKYQKQAASIKNGILKSINSNGSMIPFLIAPSYKYDPDYLLTFYSGEALLALLEYYHKIKDPELLKIIIKSQDYYINHYVVNLNRNYYPAYVPWHTLSLNHLYKITKDQKYVDAIFILNDKLLEIQDRTNHLGRFFNPLTPQYGSPHASSDGVYTEGLVYAYEIAKIINNSDKQKKYLEALQYGFKNLMNLQYTPERSEKLIYPQKVIGAFRIALATPESSFLEMAGSNVRIDSVQHTMDAFRKYFSLS